MVKESYELVSATAHRCNRLCLGPMTFHHQAVGDKVRLSDDGRLAERTQQTFRNGVVFSNRPVKVGERVSLRVLRDCPNWNGALRLGFTNVPPQNRSLPLPSMAIPDLTEGYGHWAAPMPDSYCRPGSELEFWVTSSGKVYVTINKKTKHKLLKRVDVTRPLWAMIDIYGQTSSIYLLGSEKKNFFYSRRSCPAPLPEPDAGTPPPRNPDHYIPCLDNDVSDDQGCVVCMVKEAKITLPCGHRCLCNACTFEVLLQFGTCPLCRHEIRSFRGGEEVCW